MPKFKTLGAGVSDEGQPCSKEQPLGSWIDNWQNLLAEAKIFWFISISIPDKSSVVILDVFLRELL